MYNISKIENKMQANGVYLLNPLLCMNQTYLESVLKKPYNKAKIYITRQYGIPTKILFVFSSSSDASNFIKKYNGQYFESDFN